MARRLTVVVFIAACASLAAGCLEKPTDQELDQMCRHLEELRGEVDTTPIDEIIGDLEKQFTARLEKLQSETDAALKGIDALLSTVQMPGGVPVATMSLGKAGAKNAGIFAAQILAAMDVKIANRLKVYKVEMEREVEEKAKRLVTITSIAATAKMSAPAKASAPAKVAAPARVAAPVREEEPAAEGAPAKKKSRRRRWKKKPGGTAPAQGPVA